MREHFIYGRSEPRLSCRDTRSSIRLPRPSSNEPGLGSCHLNSEFSSWLKIFGLLRPAQHERKMLDRFKLRTVRAEALEG